MMIKTALLSATALTLLVGVTPAAAQDAMPAASDAAAAQPEAAPDTGDEIRTGPGDIIVTARRRQESILKVPVVETVVTAEVLQTRQINNLTDLATIVPGLNLGSAVLSIGPQISLRGVGTSSLDAGIDQSVALNIDGLALSQGLAFSVGIFDLAQVEVLKGPQALFFGKNSPGGVVALRTNDPGSQLELIVRAGYEFVAEEKRAEVIVSGPLSDTFGIRLAGLGTMQNGFFRNRATVVNTALGARPGFRKYAPQESYIARATAKWEPSSDFEARLKVNYAYDYIDGDASHGQSSSCPEGTRAGSSGIQFINPNDDCKLNRSVWFTDMDPAAFPRIENEGRPFRELEQKFGTLELNYAGIQSVNLTSITGYYKANSDSLINSTLTGFAPPAFSAANRFARRDFTQELRADTNFSGPINLTAGAFYQDGRVYNRIRLAANIRILTPFDPARGGTGFLRTGDHTIDIKSYSAFGQLRWKIVPEIELTGGVRYTDEKRSDSPNELGRAGQVGTPIPILLAVPRIRAKNWSPEATITWTPTDDFTVFASAKQGYKSGSFTITTPVVNGSNNSFDDERVRGAEIGIKSRLADRQIAANIAGYFYKYDGLQVGVNEPAQNGLSVIRTLNAGGAEVYGVDFDIAYNPRAIDGLSLNAAVNWNHARFTELNNVPCFGGQTIALGCTLQRNPTTGRFQSQDLSGIPLVRAPDWTVTAGFNYELPVGDNRKIGFGAAGLYSSRYLRGLTRREDFYQPKYATVDANLAYGHVDDKWQVSLVGRNLTNKITAGSCTPLNQANGQVLGGQTTGAATSGPDGLDEVTCVGRRGRELWVRVAFRY